MLAQSQAELLADARERTLWLVEGVSDRDLDRVHDPLMSPLVWDLGHIAAYEDLWIAHRGAGLDLLRPDLMDVYDAFETPRHVRGDTPYLRRDQALDYLEAVRERTLDVLEGIDADRFELVLQHEHQHDETMLQTLQLAEAGVHEPERTAPAGTPRGDGPDRIGLEAGTFTMGAGKEGFAYDNERPAREVDLPAFEIDRVPVTNGAFAEFVEEGGYRRRELWDPMGWQVRGEEGWERPLYWTDDGRVRSFERVEGRDPDMPVMNVSWFEADAFARWSGARLPTEGEWERAAQGAEPGPSNLGVKAFGPAVPREESASGCGVLGMLGDAWEWTATAFSGYPGFSAHPYREYSEVFFGRGYRVLRGGSWATRRRVARHSFRNWDAPRRRQIFAGFRCARDAA